MNAKRTVAVLAVLVMALTVLTLVPVAEDDGANDLEKVYIEGGEITSTFTGTEKQIVIFQKDTTITGKGQMIIEGALEIPAGVTVTIKDGEPYSTYGIMSVFGDAKIDGNIVSKTESGLYIEPKENCEANINGTISVIGNTSGTSVKGAIVKGLPEDDMNVHVFGSFTVGTNAEVEFGNIVFEKGSKLDVNGGVEGTIVLKGVASIDGNAADFIIYLNEASATIQIQKVSGTIIVTDKKMLAYSYGGINYYINYMPDSHSDKAVTYDSDEEEFSDINANFIKLKDVSNVAVSETVATSIVYDKTISANRMCAETRTVIASLDSGKNVTSVGDTVGSINVLYVKNEARGATSAFDSMTVEDVNISIGKKSSAIIAGDVTFLNGNGTFTVAGTLTVDGVLLIKKNDVSAAGSINAAHYKVKYDVNSEDNYYATLKKAIENGAKTIDMFGTLYVKEDTVVPAGVKLQTDSEKSIGVSIKKGVTLTIADGASFDVNGKVAVYGTLTIENLNYGITYVESKIYAHIKIKNGSSVKYTYINDALKNAKAGDELEVFQPKNDTMHISEDATLPADVSLSNNSKAIVVDSGVTFTIAGKLIISGESNGKLKLRAERVWSSDIIEVEDGSVKDCSVLNIESIGSVVFEKKCGSDGMYKTNAVPGAYYTVTDNDGIKHFYITSIPYALNRILEADDNKVIISGSVNIENLSVNGTEKERMTVTVARASEVTMKNFTFSYGSIIINRTAKLTGDIGTSTGRIVLDEANVSGTVTFGYEFVDGAMNFTIDGGLKSENITSTTGTVYFKDFTYRGASIDPEEYGKNKFNVPAGSKIIVIGNAKVASCEFIVEGEVIVTNHLTDSGCASLSGTCISILGTLTVEKLDGRSGTVNYLYYLIGGSSNSYTDWKAKGSAVVDGSGKFSELNDSIVRFFNGATVSAGVLKDWMDNTAKTTEFYVDGKLWMTTYVQDKTKLINVNGEYAPVPLVGDREFNAWQTYDEKTKKYADVPVGTKVGAVGYEKVYADISSNIYKVTVIADVGIDNVYIDGKLIVMTGANTYADDVSSGTHTISYTLANGYSGNAVITDINGEKIVGGGLTFVVNSENCSDCTMEISLSGIQKSGFDTDPDTHTEESISGLSVTEILLIVVVIIIAVMAVVLILRLSRS